MKNKNIFIFIPFLVILLGMLYLFNDGWLLNKNPTKNTQVAFDHGKKIYYESCIDCHGSSLDGKGMLSDQLIVKPENLRGLSDAVWGFVAYRIANGDGEMPAFKTLLSKKEIWEVSFFIEKYDELKTVN